MRVSVRVDDNVGIERRFSRPKGLIVRAAKNLDHGVGVRGAEGKEAWRPTGPGDVRPRIVGLHARAMAICRTKR